LPSSQTLYFDLEPRAYGFAFELEAGRELTIAIEDGLSGEPALLELYAAMPAGHSPELEAVRPLGKDSLLLSVPSLTRYILRVEAPPLSIGSVALRIGSLPSLSVFPVDDRTESAVGSVWGDPRDGGRRLHEGIDVFAPRGTPLLAATGGIVERVRDRGLGGKQVWLRVPSLGLRLYYAHLDEQWVSNGEVLLAGDSLGTVGNTGNARTTPPHLHFGIYGPGGAVNPLPYVRSAEVASYPSPRSLSGDTARLRRRTRMYESQNLKGSSTRLSAKQIVHVETASETATGVRLPDGAVGFVASNLLEGLKPYGVRPIQGDSLRRNWLGQPVVISVEHDGVAELLAINEKEQVLVETPGGQQGWIDF